MNLKTIINWLYNNHGFIATSFSILVAVMSVISALSARKSRIESKKSEEKALIVSQNLALFDKRLELYNQIKHIIKNEKQYRTALDKILDINGHIHREKTDDKKITEKKFELIYDEEALSKYLNLMNDIERAKSLDFDLNTYFQIMRENQEDFYEKIKGDLLKEDQGEITDEEEKEFRDLCKENEVFYSFRADLEDYKRYNFYDLTSQINIVNQNIIEKENEIYDFIEDFIKKTLEN